MEEFIRNKANEMINDYKNKCENAGVVLTERDEQMLRAGMSYGLTLASLGLVNLPHDITFNKE